MTKVADRKAQDVALLSSTWKRQIMAYNDTILSVMADEALTGFVIYIEKPVVEEFNRLKCVCVPLASWVMAHTLASQTVTPFRVAARGNNLIIKAFNPHTGLKYPVRNTPAGLALMIPVEDFEAVSA
jgi:hypothetical protein